MIPHLAEIVEAAVVRSREVGNPILGLALRQIHHDALFDETLMNLLGAILAQKATPAQRKQFHAYVRRAKEQVKLASASARRPSATAGGDGVAATRDGTAPVEEGVAPVEDGIAPVEEGTVLAKDAAAPVEDGIAPANDGTALPILPRTRAGKKA